MVEEKKETNQEVVGKEAFENKKQILTLKQAINRDFLMTAKLLKENRDKKLWEQLDYKTFQDFLSDPEISIAPSSAYGLIEIYEKFILELKIPTSRLLTIDESKLKDILSMVQLSDVEIWLDKAATLKRADLRIEIAEAKGKTPSKRKFKASDKAMDEVSEIIKNSFSGKDTPSFVDSYIKPIAKCRFCNIIGQLHLRHIILESDDFKLKVVYCNHCEKEDLIISLNAKI